MPVRRFTDGEILTGPKLNEYGDAIDANAQAIAAGGGGSATPKASPTTSGTVKTDVAQTDPLVVTKATFDNDPRGTNSRTPTGAAGGDLSGTYPNPALAGSGVQAGTYGGDNIPVQITVDSKGRVTAAANKTVTGAGTSGTTGGTTTTQTRWWGVNINGAEFGKSNQPGTLNTDYTYDLAGASNNRLTYFASKGVALVRLPVMAQRVYDRATGTLRQTDITAIRTFLDQAQAANCKVIVDIHNYARYWGVNVETPWTTADGSVLKDMMTKLAAALKDKPALWGYEQNEPHDLVEEPGTYTGSTRYAWTSTTQGWVGGDQQTTLTANTGSGHASAGCLRVTKSIATAGYANVRLDDAGQKLGTATGNVLSVWVRLEATATGAWFGHCEWQNTAFQWSPATTGTHRIYSATGQLLSALTPGAWCEIRSDYSANPITNPNAFAIQLESNNAAVSNRVFDIDDFGQGTVAGGRTGAQVWFGLAQQMLDGVRASDMACRYLAAGYGWQSAQAWRTNNEDFLLTDPANNTLYAAHLYFDHDNSGTYSGTYDSEGATATAGVERVQPFLDWLAAKGQKGILTEYGVPNNDARWVTLLNNFVTKIAGDPNILGGTYWGAGPWWGTYPLSVEPTRDANGTVTADAPQMSAIQNRPATTTTTTGGGTTTVAGATNLDGLSDVTITNPATGQTITYNGTQWVNTTPASTSTTGGTTTTTLSTNAPFVQRVGTTFQLDGIPWIATGVNLSNAANGVADCGPVWTATDKREQFRRIADVARCSLVRVSFYQGYAPSTGGVTNFAGLDSAVALAKEYGLRLMVTFEDHWGHCFGDTTKVDTWYTTTYANSTYNNYALAYKEYVRRVVDRYKNDPTIFAWSLMNEATPRSQSTNAYNLSALLSFTTDMAAYVKSIDANHLVTIGMGGTDDPDSGEAWRQVHSLANVDFADVHYYADSNIPWPGQAATYTNTQTSLAARVWQTQQLGKPVIIGETGDTVPDPPLTRAVNMNNRIGAAFDNGVRAVCMWAWEPLNYGEHSINVGDPLVESLAGHAGNLWGDVIAAGAPLLLPPNAPQAKQALVKARADQTTGTPWTPGMWLKSDAWRAMEEGTMRPRYFQDGYRADGTVNCTTGIQRAIAEAGAWAVAGLRFQNSSGTFQGGAAAPGAGRVPLDPGTQLADAILLHHRVEFFGLNWGSVLKRTAGQSGPFIRNQYDATRHAKYVYIHGFQIDGNDANQTVDGTAITLEGNTTNTYTDPLDEDYDNASSIEGVYIRNVRGHGIELVGAGANFVGGRTKIRNVRGSGIVAGQDNNINWVDIGWTGAAGLVLSGDSNRVTNVKAWYCGQYQTNANVPGVWATADSGVMTGVTVQDCRGQGFLFDGAYGWSCAGLEADSCNSTTGGAAVANYAGFDVYNSQYIVINGVVRNRYRSSGATGTILTALNHAGGSDFNDIRLAGAKGVWGVSTSWSTGSVRNTASIVVNGQAMP